MKAFLVTYDLKAPLRNYNGLYDALKKCPKWWHFLESSWIVLTDETPTDLWNRFAPSIDSNDFLLIIEVRDNVQGWLPKKAWDWIHENVPKF